MSVIALGAVGAFIVAEVFAMSIDGAKTLTAAARGEKARAYAEACVEHVLLAVRNDVTVTASGTLAMPEGGCDFAVADGGGDKVIDARGEYAGAVLRVRATVSTAGTLAITSWSDIPLP